MKESGDTTADAGDRGDQTFASEGFVDLVRSLVGNDEQPSQEYVDLSYSVLLNTAPFNLAAHYPLQRAVTAMTKDDLNARLETLTPRGAEFLKAVTGLHETTQALVDIVWDLVSQEEFLRSLCEAFISRTVDAFQFYLVRMLSRVFNERPETLRSNETITIKEVLECGDMETFIDRYAEQKVEALGFQSMSGLTKYFRERLGMEVVETTADYQKTYEYIEVRNIIAHYGGFVSRTYLARTANNPYRPITAELHKPYPLSWDYAFMGGFTLLRLAKTLDAEFIGHFSLQVESAINDDEASRSKIDGEQ
jgi:hypothetical protein